MTQVGCHTGTAINTIGHHYHQISCWKCIIVMSIVLKGVPRAAPPRPLEPLSCILRVSSAAPSFSPTVNPCHIDICASKNRLSMGTTQRLQRTHQVKGVGISTAVQKEPDYVKVAIVRSPDQRSLLHLHTHDHIEPTSQGAPPLMNHKKKSPAGHTMCCGMTAAVVAD